jgi:transposase
MQGKDMSERKAVGELYVGIDVSKSWLDVHVLPSGESWRVANSGPGYRLLARRLGKRVALIALEATGKWHRPLHRALHAGGFKVAVTDPYRTRQFAKSIGQAAKTDRIDARVLAVYAMAIKPDAAAPPPEIMETLKELVAARAAAIAEAAGLANQIGASKHPLPIRLLKRRKAQIDRDVDKLDAEIGRIIAAEPALARRREILLSVPGFGPVVAATLVAMLAELGDCNAKEIAMLAGLAPIADESGQRQGPRSIGGGRAAPRRVLYLAALSAVRCNPGMKAVYDRLTAQGKRAKVALVAVARKLAVLANALIKQNRLWQPNHA